MAATSYSRQMVMELQGSIVKEVADLLAMSAVEREVFAPALNSMAGAMARVAPDQQEELQQLVADFMADPGDRDTVARLGALLKATAIQ